MMTKILSVAAGGAIGSVARYLLSISPLAGTSEKFPVPTFVINVTGSFLIGFLFILLTERFPASESLRLAVIVGFLGAYTTFSTFEFELLWLTKERYVAAAFLYLFLSIAAGFAGVIAGISLARRI